MTPAKTDRRMAEPIGRIMCCETGEEIGLLYKWDNNETQAALYSDWDVERIITDFEGTS